MVFQNSFFYCCDLTIKIVHELLGSDTTFGERYKAPLNLAKSGNWSSPLLTFQMNEMNQQNLKNSVKNIFFTENDWKISKVIVELRTLAFTSILQS